MKQTRSLALWLLVFSFAVGILAGCTGEAKVDAPATRDGGMSKNPNAKPGTPGQ